MKILVDTSVWSLVLRKQEKTAREEQIVTKLSKIIRDLNLVMIGPIRQEILSGVSDNKRFEDLRQRIAIFPDYNRHSAHSEQKFYLIYIYKSIFY